MKTVISKIFVIAFALIMTAAIFTACGNKGDSSDTTEVTTAEVTTSEVTTAEVTTAKATTEDVTVVQDGTLPPLEYHNYGTSYDEQGRPIIVDYAATSEGGQR